MTKEDLSDEEIARRLKIIQLKREELGLAKDIARIERVKNLNSLFERLKYIISTIKSYLTIWLLKILAFTRKNIWRIVFIPLFFVVLFNVIDYSEKIRIDKYIDARDEYVAECGSVSYKDRFLNPDFSEKIYDCRHEREKSFKKKYKPFLIINDDYHL